MQKRFLCTSPFITETVKKKILKDQAFVILIIYCFIMDIFKWNMKFLKSKCVVEKSKYTDCEYNLVPRPWFINSLHLLFTISTKVNSEKSKRHIGTIMKIVWENHCSMMLLLSGCTSIKYMSQRLKIFEDPKEWWFKSRISVTQVILEHNISDTHTIYLIYRKKGNVIRILYHWRNNNLLCLIPCSA